MKSRLANIGYVFAAVVVLGLAVFGYVCYERTLVAWWLPVLLSASLALLTYSLLSRLWQKLTGTEGVLNILCHLYAIGGICYFLLLGGNYLLADSASAHTEEVQILNKEHVVRTVGSRSARRYRSTYRKKDYYYLTVRFTDGTCKEVPVSLSVYNHSKKDGVRTFNMQKGFFGFRVIK